MVTDYKNTLNLPRTDFPMKADLITREPQRLEKWQQADLYAKIQASRTAAPKFVLHDGPPFANGDVHIGTALNKILKDIIIKYQTLRGKSAPYIPGWDCHGLPIEFKVSQDMRKAGDTSADASTIRKACEVYARKYIDIQRTQFKRLGVLGDWENPYLTLNKEYEADELRMFADIVAKGFVYRGKKPVYWSIPCRTALAEAEVEYKDHVSQSVFVKFPLRKHNYTSETHEAVGLYGKGKLLQKETFNVPDKWFLVIWTTTPWTLPANLAVAINTTLDYSVVQIGLENYVIAQDSVASVAEKCGWKDHKIIQKLEGYKILGWFYDHPFIQRASAVVMGDTFVEKTTGTGFVHIAPGHGLEDYQVGRIEKLPAYSPVDDDGRLCLTDDIANKIPIGQQMPPELLGKSLLEKNGKSEANEAVVQLLQKHGMLLHEEKYSHSYPHCWRSKTPVIFRAMDQWFIGVDKAANEEESHRASKLASYERPAAGDAFANGETLRIAAQNAIVNVNWIPDWGRSRIEGAVKSRPDWCISRQRTWGVPIPVFFGPKGEIFLNPKLIENVAELIREHGSNIWFEKSAVELWTLVKPKDWNGPDAVAKSNDTLDVWIDSGSSSRAVLMRRGELQHKVGQASRLPDERASASSQEVAPTASARAGETPAQLWQADVYLEGSDQHRGWFQSSLLLSLAGNGAAPFKTVLTHGFMVDADREKISKSKQGAYEKPQTAEAYVKKYGADVVRLWVASQDYRSDIVVSEERINKVGETYRGIRNALRYQLSNLYDFDPARHTVPDDKLTGLDRWILGEFAKLEAEVLAAYDQYEFHVVYQKLSQFIAVELSSVYHDVIKDRLYTDAANSPRRRSTQTALHGLVTGLCQMLAPILAFTADEAWEFVPGKPTGSVHEAVLEPRSSQLGEEINWEKLFLVRENCLEKLEKNRKDKVIGKSLDAKVNIALSAVTRPGIADRKEVLREILNVSQLDFLGSPQDSQMMDITVSKADGQKCERCWHWETDIGQNADHPTICGRCVEAVKQSGAK